MKEKRNKKIIKNVKGITLIALVVTIIVLLILAGVSINIAFNTGIISKSKNATAKYQEATANETNSLNYIEGWMDAQSTSNPATPTITPATATTVVGAIEEGKEGKYYDKTTAITDSSTTPATVTVPAGFKIASDSATTVAGGVVIEDTNSNQYVWIPVATINDYSRKSFKGEDITTNYTETMPTDEQTSVTKNKGYYIGRYEAGINTARTEIGDQTKTTMADLGEVLEQKGKSTYSYVTKNQAEALAEEVDTHYNYSTTLTTKLCSSYAWDTALKFIDQNSINSSYSTNSSQGNYYGQTFNYTDINGTEQTKAANSDTLVPTGSTTAVCNIYDMGGNVWEWTTESCSDASYPCVSRGGNCDVSATDYPAGSRFYRTTSVSGGYIGFRVTLYL